MYSDPGASFIEKISASGQIIPISPHTSPAGDFPGRLKPNVMKKIVSFLFITVMAVLLQNCIVKSIHPFFLESDVIFKKELLATWTDQEGGQWTIKPFGAKPNAYEMHWTQDGKNVVFLAHLFNLQGELYFDFLPLSDGKNEDFALFTLHLMPTHSIAKVEVLNKEEVRIKWFNEDWMRSLFDQNRIKISHEVIYDEAPKDDDDKIYILTAPTDELQKFVIKYGGEDAAFNSENTVGLTLKRHN